MDDQGNAPPLKEWERVLFEALAERPDVSEDDVHAALLALIDETARGTIDELRRDASGMLVEQAANRAHFETSLRDPWGPAFDHFETLLVAAQEAGVLFGERHRDEANTVEPEGDPLFYAQVRLQRRACRAASEIFALLRTGHPQGALARWRTLHEIAVTMAFLNQHGRTLAERYLRHDAIASYRALMAFQLHAEKIGETPFSDEEATRIRAERDELVAQHGPAYDGEYGWAYGVLSVRPTFAAIEREAKLDHWRPYVNWASQNIHAGPKGIIVENVLADGREIFVYGPQSHDLADPGQNAALHLSLATVELLVSKPTFDSLVQVHVLRTLAAETAAAFLEAQGEMDRKGTEETGGEGSSLTVDRPG